MNIRKLIFETWDKWNSRSYLRTYYSKPMQDTFAVIDFLDDSLKEVPKKKFNNAIDFGAGPTLFSALTLEPYIKNLDIAEYLPQNIKEIQNWIDKDSEAFDWTYWASYVLRKQIGSSKKSQIEERFESLRSKMRDIFIGDATTNWPTSDKDNKRYDLVVSLFCAESITESKKEWKRNLHNILKLAAPHGTVLISALRNCSSYKVGKSNFPATPINEFDLEVAIRESSLKIKRLDIEVRDVPECKPEGFSSILLARLVIK